MCPAQTGDNDDGAGVILERQNFVIGKERKHERSKAKGDCKSKPRTKRGEARESI
ncbi:hypothetical protein HPP92_004750 [Vanilla planifolia]|uniref:Uncharacterized protein n=1 Tax=Vanilla planifolia TaxID=51239 RepID=A0A835RS39_VANPL|nr:hypothetical protein HPP92_005102 [Vanilla planifolia]KAG0493756.1 hypothetical protein HPP92_004750 [Vanilla planifolia]